MKNSNTPVLAFPKYRSSANAIKNINSILVSMTENCRRRIITTIGYNSMIGKNNSHIMPKW
jgi:hypothetical protein